MDFGLAEDQLMLEKSVRQFLSDQIPIERVRELRDLDCPNDRSLWKSLAELGVTGILISEKLGGSGLALLDAALVSEALGHAVAPSAFLGTSVMASIALDAFDAAKAEPWLSAVATGDLRIGVAFMERISVREGAGTSRYRPIDRLMWVLVLTVSTELLAVHFPWFMEASNVMSYHDGTDSDHSIN